MWTFIARRLVQSVIVVLGVTVISFISLQLGGDPTYLFVSERASAEEIQMVREALGFDRPLHIQYLTYVGNILQGEFGNSLSYRQPAMGMSWAHARDHRAHPGVHALRDHARHPVRRLRGALPGSGSGRVDHDAGHVRPVHSPASGWGS
jgi:hypothetical protein